MLIMNHGDCMPPTIIKIDLKLKLFKINYAATISNPETELPKENKSAKQNLNPG